LGASLDLVVSAGTWAKTQDRSRVKNFSAGFHFLGGPCALVGEGDHGNAFSKEKTMRTFAKVSARLFTAVLALASFAPFTQAQDASFVARVNVPFVFEVASGHQLQPGVYDIVINGSETVLLRGANGASMAMIWERANEGMPVTQGKAVFTHYGDKYYLRSVSSSGSSTRLLFAESKHERESKIAYGKSTKNVELASIPPGR
jgi:hypothetical protein